MEPLTGLLSKHHNLFHDFNGREEYLAKIIRYKNYPHKIFPTSLKSHQHQVAALVLHLADQIGWNKNQISFDPRKTLFMAWVHDDHEIFMNLGDFQSVNEVHMTAEEIRVLEGDEKQAIQRAIEHFPPQISDYSYAELLWDAAHNMETAESQFMKVCDKLVGLGEALHEIFSGNNSFLYGVTDPIFNRNNPAPVEYYRMYFSCLKKKLPLLNEALNSVNHFVFQPFSNDKLPLNHYQFWREALIKYAPEWERKRLFS